MAKPLRGECEVDLGGEKFTLRLGIGELEELDNATGLGTLELLRSFSANAKISNVVAVLHQALPCAKDKKLPVAQVRRIVERAGFQGAVIACVNIISAVLADPTEGNAVAAEAEKETPTAA